MWKGESREFMRASRRMKVLITHQIHHFLGQRKKKPHTINWTRAMDIGSWSEISDIVLYKSSAEQRPLHFNIHSECPNLSDTLFEGI